MPVYTGMERRVRLDKLVEFDKLPIRLGYDDSYSRIARAGVFFAGKQGDQGGQLSHRSRSMLDFKGKML